MARFFSRLASGASGVRRSGKRLQRVARVGLEPLEPRWVLSGPQAMLQVLDLRVPGPPEYVFTVAYTSDVALNTATIDSADVRVTGPGGYDVAAKLVAHWGHTPQTPETAMYRIDAPGDIWDGSDNGTYEVHMQAYQVADRSGVFVPAGSLGTFEVDIFIDIEGGGNWHWNGNRTRPTAELQAEPLSTSGAATYSFQVVYTDDQAVDVSDLDDRDLRVSGPGLYWHRATFVSVDDDTDGATRTATYEIDAPGDTWDEGDNGTFTVWLMPWQVSDTSGAYARFARLGTFTVDIGQTGTGGNGGEGESYEVTVSDDRFVFDDGDIRLRQGAHLQGADPVVDLTVTVHNSDDSSVDFSLSVRANPWQNATRPFDVDKDGYVAPRDALQIINRLNSDGTCVLPLVAVDAVLESVLIDTNGDHHLTPLDALLVINHLNRVAGDGGEGEGGPVTAATLPLTAPPTLDESGTLLSSSAPVQTVVERDMQVAMQPLLTGFAPPAVASTSDGAGTSDSASDSGDILSDVLDLLANQLARHRWWNR